ncbi:MAG: HAD family hydrolase [Pseudonocardiaceae bacterium]
MTEIDRTLVLWDVDHTLIENSGVSKATYSRAFEMLTGRSSAVPPATDGRTDFEILSNLFEVNSLTAPPQYRRAFERALTAAMNENCEGLKARGYALAGAEDTLAALARIPNVIQSVLTGNIANNAREKLAAFSLDLYLDLDVGGYGSDDIVRSRLAAFACRKVFERYGVEFDRSSTIMIGDTVRDVRAALDGDASIIGVATGPNSSCELLDAGANAAIENLEDFDEFIRVLHKVRGGES